MYHTHTVQYFTYMLHLYHLKDVLMQRNLHALHAVTGSLGHGLIIPSA